MTFNETRALAVETCERVVREQGAAAQLCDVCGREPKFQGRDLCAECEIVSLEWTLDLARDWMDRYEARIAVLEGRASQWPRRAA
jgi:hypothetical protein